MGDDAGKERQTYKRVRSVQEGLDLLNTERSTMFAFIPLKKTEYLDQFTANIRDKGLCSFFAGVFNEHTKDCIDNMFLYLVSTSWTVSGGLLR